MEHAHTKSHSSSHEEHGHEEGEPIVVKILKPNEVLAKDLSEYGIVAEALERGSHPLEGKPYYSHKFGLNSKFTTNRGMIKVSGKNFDLIQVLQRN